MILDATSQTLEAILAGAKTTVDCPVIVDYVDNDATTFTPGVQITNTNGIAAVTILSAITSSHFRKVNAINLYNVDTGSITVTFRYLVTATNYTLFKATLAVGESVRYTDASGWQLFDAAGAPKMVSSGSGVWLGSFVKTSGTTYTTGPRTTTLFVRMVGGGGGGGGCTSVAAAAGAAGGGGAGGYAEKTFTVTPSTNYTYQVGAAGTGASGAGGNNGTSSTFAVGATTVTAFLGTGAVVMAPAGTLKTGAGGAGGVISTNGDVNGAGAPGAYGVCLIVATPILASGAGGSGPFGAGGIGIIAVGNGNPGVGFGAGGGGSATGASTVRTGGNGTAGVVIVDEYA